MFILLLLLVYKRVIKFNLYKVNVFLNNVMKSCTIFSQFFPRKPINTVTLLIKCNYFFMSYNNTYEACIFNLYVKYLK